MPKFAYGKLYVSPEHVTGDTTRREKLKKRKLLDFSGNFRILELKW